MGTKTVSDTYKDIGKRKTSFVNDLIDFKAKENPSWRKKDMPSVETMLKEIIEFHKRWNLVQNRFGTEELNKVNSDFFVQFIFRVNHEEGHGFKTYEETKRCLTNFESQLRRDVSLKERETVNLSAAHKYLVELAEKENDTKLKGLLESSVLQEVHKRIFYNIELPRKLTEPGKFSNLRRYTQFGGEKYEYPILENMHESVATLLDRYNSLLMSIKTEEDDLTRIYDLFKTCAVLLFELLDLHPFSDGNGRLSRLLCNYCLSICTPFPMPIYNIWNSSSKDDYIQMLVDARKSNMRYPESLVTMIIECNWFGWKTYFKALQTCKLEDFRH